MIEDKWIYNVRIFAIYWDYESEIVINISYE